MSIEFKVSQGYISLIYKSNKVVNVLGSEPINNNNLSKCIEKLLSNTNINGLL